MAHELRRRLDYSDILATPSDGERYELVQGELFVNPSPNPIHQRISRRLERQLEDYFHERSIGEVFDAPIDVILTPHDVLVPDLLVVADPNHISKRGTEKPPLLVVEILSPSTRKVDRGVKSRRYAEPESNTTGSSIPNERAWSVITLRRARSGWPLMPKETRRSRIPTGKG